MDLDAQAAIQHRVECRCGFKGEWRANREQALDDRIAHKNAAKR